MLVLVVIARENFDKYKRLHTIHVFKTKRLAGMGFLRKPRR